MRTNLGLISALLFAGTVAWATPSCFTDTLTNYAANNFSCLIGDKTFSGFMFALSSVAGSGTATPISSDSIMVVPGGNSAGQTFSFQAAYLASGLSASEILTVGFTGMAPVNDAFIAAALSLSGASVSGAGLI